MVWLYFIRVLTFSICVAKAELMLESSTIADLLEEYKAALQDAELEILNQEISSFSEDNQPPAFQMPSDFMHAFRPNTGVGNREDLIIEQVRNVEVYDDGNFLKWRYFRFNNSDYLLGINSNQVICWRKNIDPTYPIDLSIHEAVFKYETEQKGNISEAVIFIRRYHLVDVLHVAILTENRRSSFVSIYEVLEDKALMVTVIDLGFSTKNYLEEPSSKLAEIQSWHSNSLIVLVSGVDELKIVYQQKGNNILNHYIEVHYPSAIDMVSFTIGRHGYIAVANATSCTIFKMDEFLQNHNLLESIVISGIMDLEYFRLGFHHYLVISTRNVQTLYMWKKGCFHKKQEFQSTDVLQAYGALLPNCRDDVILILIKEYAAPDLFVWNGQNEIFVTVKTSIPYTFDPRPGTIAAFSYGATAFVLFVGRMGLNKLFAIDTKLSPVPDPVLLFGKEVDNLMQDVQEKFIEQENKIREMSSVLENAVTSSGYQHFEAFQTFENLQSSESISADLHSIYTIRWEGSTITLEDYLAGTQGLESKMASLEAALDRLESIVPDIVRIDEDAVITGQKVFTGKITGSSVIARSLNMEYAGGVNIRELQKQIYRIDKPMPIKGVLVFKGDLHIHGNLDVMGTINGIDFSRDVMTTNTDQESNAEMVFNTLIINGDLSLAGKLNGIDIGSEVVTLYDNHRITGNITFGEGLTVENMQANFIDGVDVNRLFTKSLTISGNQIITSPMHFKGVFHTEDVILTGTLNSHNITQLAQDVIRIDEPAVVNGHITFVDDIVIDNSLKVSGKINGLKIPDDLFLKDVNNIVTGVKTFTGTLTAQDVIVSGAVDGLVLPRDIITLSGEEIINTTLHFNEGISVEKDIIVGGLVDGVDISELAKDALKMNETNLIENAEFQGEVVIKGDIIVDGFVNGIMLNDLIEDIVYKTDEDVVITGEKIFTSVFADKVILGGKINGYDIQKDFMTVNGDQTITGVKTFGKSVTLQSLITEDGMIDGVNLTNLYQNRISLSIEDEVIDGDIAFANDVIISGDLTLHGTLGGYKFPENFVLKSMEQTLTGTKFAKPLIIDDLIVSGNIKVNGTFAGVKLPEFFHQRVSLTADEEIIGDMVLGNTTAERVHIAGLVNGLNIVDFANNVLSLTKDQNITGYKEFSGVTHVYGPMTTAEGINGINLADINRRAFKLSAPVIIATPVTFTDSVYFEDISVSGLINGVNLTDLDENSVKTEGLQHITADTMFHHGFHVEGDIQAADINGLNLQRDILTKNTFQNITGSYTFKDVSIEGNLKVSGLVNGIDLSEIAPILAKSDSDNIIYSDLIFKEPVHVSGDVDVSGFVNGMNLENVQKTAMLKTGQQHVQGHKILKGNVTVHGDVDVLYVNNITWKDFLEDVIRIDEPKTVSSRKVWLSDMEVRRDVYVSGFAEVGLLNGINLTKFVDEAVFVHRPANITGTKVFLNPVEIAGDLNAELINGINLKKDVIILQCGDNETQVITGEKTFQNLTVYGDIMVHGFVNGYKLPEVVANTLTIDGDQTITGHKKLHKEVKFLKNVHPGSVNGLKLSQDLVTLGTEQEIEGDIIFNGHVQIKKDLVVAGSINGVDIEELAREALYYDSEQEIEGNYRIDNAVVESDIFVDGLVNGINLDMFSQNVSKFWKESKSELNILVEKSEEHCERVEELHSYFEGSYYILDGFLLHQVLNFSSDLAELRDGYLTISHINSNNMVNIRRYKFSHSGNFQYMDSEVVKVFKKKIYDISERELTIQFEVNTKESMVLIDGDAIPNVPQGFSDAEALVLNGRAVLAFLYPSESVCRTFEVTSNSAYFEPLGSITVNDATSIVLFDMLETVYLAVSCYSSLFNEDSKLYAFIKGNWQLVQSIPAAASSGVLHFSFHGYHYLAFSNAVPIHKTKEPMSVQVYRNTELDLVPLSLLQKIPFDNAKSLEIFKFGDLSELYLVVSNQTRVGVFRLEGESGFQTSFVLHGECITSVRPFILENQLFVVVSQKEQVFTKPAITKIYKGLTQGWTIPSRKLNNCS